MITYKKYVRILKYLSIVLFAYAITAVIVGGSWNQIIIASIIPHIEFSSSYIALLVAIFGASLSPYLYFWQASQEAEEAVDKYNIRLALRLKILSTSDWLLYIRMCVQTKK